MIAINKKRTYSIQMSRVTSVQNGRTTTRVSEPKTPHTVGETVCL